MPDNLSVKVGVDWGQARTDLELLKREVQSTAKEMKKIGDEASRTGDTRGLQQISRAYEALREEMAAANKELAQHYRALNSVGTAAAGASKGLVAAAEGARVVEKTHSAASREVVKLSKEFANADLNAFSFVKTLREFPKTAAGVAVVAGAAYAAAKAIDATADAAVKLGDLSDVTGRSKADLIAMEKALIGANVAADKLDPMMRKLSEDFTKAHANAAGIADAISGVQTMRGGQGPRGPEVLAGTRPGQAAGSGFEGGALVFRGGQPLQLDISKGLAGLVDPQRFRQDAEGQKKWQEEALKVLSQINQTNHALAIEIARAQAPGMQPEEALRGLLAIGRPGTMAQARRDTAGDARARDETTKSAEEYQTALKEAADSAARLRDTNLAPSLSKTAQGIDATTEAVKGLDKQLQEGGAIFDQVTREMADQSKVESSTITFQDAWTSAFQNIENAWSKTLSAITASPPPAATAPIPKPAGGMAEGGQVPGSGSGDTVPAWLTPGEYVARRASVDYYGAGVFSALNNRALPRDLFSRVGYAMGGLVGDVRHFAEGGLVATAGGTPVHLHLGGRSFEMSASSSVASALVHEAGREQLRSAGIKPSWYGGRPGS